MERWAYQFELTSDYMGNGASSCKILTLKSMIIWNLSLNSSIRVVDALILKDVLCGFVS